MAVLALKISELAFIEEKTGEKPILLLDDIFSELDKDHRGQVLSLINNYQTILTATEENLVNKKFLAKMKILVIDKKPPLLADRKKLV
jgi:DNA replication and repair protein RecF